MKNNNKDFARIQRFSPSLDIIRGHASCSRRITIRGHGGTVHPFIVQHPAGRHGRREERIVQLFRIFNTILERKKESRRRNLKFYLPILVPLAPQVRLVQDDPSYETLQEIYEYHCKEYGMNKDDPTIHYTERIRSILLSDDPNNKRTVIFILEVRQNGLTARILIENGTSKSQSRNFSRDCCPLCS